MVRNFTDHKNRQSLINKWNDHNRSQNHIIDEFIASEPSVNSTSFSTNDPRGVYEGLSFEPPKCQTSLGTLGLAGFMLKVLNRKTSITPGETVELITIEL